MYKERKIVYLECDICGQEFDQGSEGGVNSVRRDAFMGGWVMHNGHDICGSCLHDILIEHLDAHLST